MNRRAFLLTGATAALSRANDGLRLCVFSKHLHWAGLEGCAERMAELGCDSLDLTVRRGGHIEPERVEDDLPKAVALFAGRGLRVPMITTDIRDTSSPYAAQVLRTMKSLGIRDYRWGGFRYDLSRNLPGQLETLRPRVKELASMNREHGVRAMYHTHSGRGQVGASMWDLYLLLRDCNPDEVSVNYDIGHATVEGGYGGWLHSARLLLPYTRGVAVKDFRWQRDEKGAWRVGWCPLGEGMVDFPGFFGMLKEAGFRGPLQLHMEYPGLGGAESGRRQLTLPPAQVMAKMRRDVDALKAYLRGASLA